jgi:hypothetical protein
MPPPETSRNATIDRYILMTVCILVLSVWGKYVGVCSVTSAYVNGPALAAKTCGVKPDEFRVRFDYTTRDTYLEFKCPKSSILHEGLYEQGDPNWLGA